MPDPVAPAPRLGLRRVYLASWVVLVATAVIAFALGKIGREVLGWRDAEDIAEIFWLVIGTPLAILWLGSALWWIHDAWSSLPEELREAPVVGRVRPPMAVGLFFVPCFNIVWMFVGNIALASAYQRALEARGSPTRVPAGLAVAAAVAQALPYCGMIVAPPIWFVFMSRIDRARIELRDS